MSLFDQDVPWGLVVVPCSDLDAETAFFVERLGMRIEGVFPADGPRAVIVSGLGIRLRLDSCAAAVPGVVEVVGPGEPAVLRSPGGTRVHLTGASVPVPRPSLVPSVVVRNAADGDWGVGRAGMHYRDLIPDRHGGAVIASHIRIPEGGPVPDYVHFHRVRFQMIFCHRGWVRVVYEDQGAPFTMEPGDLVLQPPQIRHRVLESSDGLEVVEIGCPAEHETWADHERALPTPVSRPDRAFAGQRFLRSVAAAATWDAWSGSGFTVRTTGMRDATGGVADVRVVRGGTGDSPELAHDADVRLVFVRAGEATLAIDDRHETWRLGEGSAFSVPRGVGHRLSACSDGFEFLEVTVPDVSAPSA